MCLIALESGAEPAVGFRSAALVVVERVSGCWWLVQQERYAFNRLIQVGRQAGFLPDKITMLVDTMAQHGAGATQSYT